VRPGYDGTPAYLVLGDSFEQTIIHRSLKQRFSEGKEWIKTPIVSEAKYLVENKDVPWSGRNSLDAIKQRCMEIDLLYNTIVSEGYKTQFDLIDQAQIRHVGFLDALANEILVDIGRNGEFLFVNGRHRLSIAKILDLETIPIVVLVRHEKWMNKRDSFYIGESTSEHPDVPVMS
jgi:hypothetical protein